MDLRIKKIKITSDNRIQVAYQKRVKNVWDEYSFTCSDAPRPELYAALKSLAPYVIEMCELPEDYQDRIDVRGVTFSYSGENEVMGATIIAQMELKNSYTKLNLNTPHKASEPYSEVSVPDEMQLLSDDCVKALGELCEEVVLYIEGERAQQSLFASIQ